MIKGWLALAAMIVGTAMATAVLTIDGNQEYIAVPAGVLIGVGLVVVVNELMP